MGSWFLTEAEMPIPPYESILDPSKEKWGSEIYFLSLDKTNTKNYQKLPKGAYVALAAWWGQIPPCISVILGVFSHNDKK